MANNIRIKNLAIGTLIGMLILSVAYMAVKKHRSSITISERIDAIKLNSGARIRNKVQQSGLDFPPARLTLSANKTTRLLKVYGYDQNNIPIEITSYPFTGFSGKLGPKLREGDRQIPEGIYNITALNPRSRFHLSIRIEYPNTFDKRMAQKDNRQHPGSDIYIHGGTQSIGCIPIGNDNIEELFTLIEATGLKNTEIVITPKNLAGINIDAQNYPIAWQKQLYKTIQAFTKKLPNP